MRREFEYTVQFTSNQSANLVDTCPSSVESRVFFPIVVNHGHVHQLVLRQHWFFKSRHAISHSLDSRTCLYWSTLVVAVPYKSELMTPFIIHIDRLYTCLLGEHMWLEMLFGSNLDFIYVRCTLFFNSYTYCFNVHILPIHTFIWIGVVKSAHTDTQIWNIRKAYSWR